MWLDHCSTRRRPSKVLYVTWRKGERIMSTQSVVDPHSRPFLGTPSYRIPEPRLPSCPTLIRRSEAMRGLSFFHGVPDHELYRLAEPALLRRFERGRSILRAGASEDCVILLEGRAKTSMPRGVGCGEFALGIFEAGDILSEGCWATQAVPITSETVALDHSHVLFLPGRPLAAFLERHGRVAMRFLDATAGKLRRVMDLATQTSCMDVGDRLYRRLVEISLLRGHRLPDGAIRVEHGLFQGELAASIGASREAVNRQLALWRDQGFVESGRRFVLVKDPVGLTMAVSLAARDVGFVLEADNGRVRRAG